MLKSSLTVLRLPVAHPDRAEPHRVGRSVVKGYVTKHNKKFTLKEIEELVPHGIRQVTPQMWKKFCDHTVKMEEEYWKKDLIEDVVEEILNTVGDDDSDTSKEELEPDNDDVRCTLSLNWFCISSSNTYEGKAML